MAPTPRAVSAATGAFVDPGRGFLQSTGFVLDPAGKVVVSVYSSGAIGRLVPDDVHRADPLPALARGKRDGMSSDTVASVNTTDDADLHFYFDPVCPFAWMTSKWVRMVAEQRDYRVDWRFISLRLINAHLDYDSRGAQ